MPAAPRQKGKAQKIAFSILGTPANLKERKTAKQKEIDRKLNQQNTSRIK